MFYFFPRSLWTNNTLIVFIWCRLQSNYHLFSLYLHSRHDKMDFACSSQFMSIIEIRNCSQEQHHCNRQMIAYDNKSTCHALLLSGNHLDIIVRRQFRLLFVHKKWSLRNKSILWLNYWFPKGDFLWQCCICPGKNVPEFFLQNLLTIKKTKILTSVERVVQTKMYCLQYISSKIHKAEKTWHSKTLTSWDKTVWKSDKMIT